MRIALLSPGPSLRRTFDAAQAYDLRIGVNTAAAIYEVDWWCCADEWRFKDIIPRRFPPLFMIAAERDKALARHPKKLAQHHVETWEDRIAAWNAAGKHEIKTGWISWSCPTALVLAASLGATSIDVYGADMSGEADAVEANDLVKRNRRPERWSREIEIAWLPLTKWCAEQGIEVRRFTDPTSRALPGDILISEATLAGA